MEEAIPVFSLTPEALMRRCHSEAMQDYRRQDNAAMWERPLQRPVRFPLAEYNLKKRISQAIKLYIEEAGIGE